ncbi:Leucine-rich repeat (LRR) family protein [Abeliophyllum distichum]|uniref:Leucine-rich repeat (LRR) family protein n=1 Tax=Abeliophyllum distichum TaxID=126358 RepID=A0ABD1VNW7_9LAMI
MKLQRTLWAVVNTTEDYMDGNSTYYEGIFKPTGKILNGLAANTYTDSDLFISALEVVLLWDQLYNSTDFNTYALSLVARHSFGFRGSKIRIAYSDGIVFDVVGDRRGTTRGRNQLSLLIIRN